MYVIIFWVAVNNSSINLTGIVVPGEFIVLIYGPFFFKVDIQQRIYTLCKILACLSHPERDSSICTLSQNF